MTQPTENGMTRREAMKTSGKLAVASAIATAAVPQIYAGENNTIQVALVGCGGRGTGAAENAISAKGGPIKLVAMADVFKDRLGNSFNELQPRFAKQMDVPDSRKFISFDGYKHAMDSLKPGDVVILATPPAFRWVHFTYAIQKGLNVFMEKPITVDGPSTRKMLKLGEDSERRNMKVGVGLMCRHCASRHDLIKQIQDGKLGEITLLRAYRMAGPTATAFSDPKPAGISELEYQIRRFHSFLWASGGAYSDFLIHNIDECCWMKGAWPTQAKSSGGRHYRGNYIDQNFDSYTTEFTYPDGSKFYLEGRTMAGCHQEFASYAHGTKGSAIISSAGHTPAHCATFKGQDVTKKSDITWRCKSPEPDPYQLEWDHLIHAIRTDKHYNEVKRGAEASLITAMGRMSAHTGRIITRDQMLNCEHEFAPEVDRLAFDSASPLRAGTDGKYPVPEPGIKTKREF